MTLVKDDLIQTLYDQSGFSKQKARTTVETVFELAKKALESGEDVLISGFGKFSVKRKLHVREEILPRGRICLSTPGRWLCSGARQ